MNTIVIPTRQTAGSARALTRFLQIAYTYCLFVFVARVRATGIVRAAPAPAPVPAAACAARRLIASLLSYKLLFRGLN